MKWWGKIHTTFLLSGGMRQIPHTQEYTDTFKFYHNLRIGFSWPQYQIQMVHPLQREP